jgi:hypothetical protein
LKSNPPDGHRAESTRSIEQKGAGFEARTTTIRATVVRRRGGLAGFEAGTTTIRGTVARRRGGSVHLELPKSKEKVMKK